MSGKKCRVTITVDPDVGAHAQRLVEDGRAVSVSAAFNDAMLALAVRDRRRLDLLRDRANQASPARVARMMASVNRQLAR